MPAAVSTIGPARGKDVSMHSESGASRRLTLGLATAGGMLLCCRIACAGLWVTGYYPAYRQSYLPPAKIDFTTVTHVIHFSVEPNSDGSLNTAGSGITPAYSADLISHAHAAGRKVILCVGGADTEAGFQGAAASANLATFISNLTNFTATYGYDGIDIDWEPLPASDTTQFTNLVNGLRSALNGFSQRKLLTVAAGAYPPYGDPPGAQYAMFAALQNQFDQINVMTYDMAGPYPGWVTWFNAPIYDGGYHFPSSGGLIPSAAGAITNFISNGVASARLGAGIAFYGDIWSGGAGTPTGGASLPRQSWTTAPNVTPIAYFNLMSTYFQSNLYHWDTGAQAAYLSIDKAGSANDEFISYDDEHTCQAKVSYARNRHLGGVMIWELGQGYRPTQPASQRDPLVQAIKQALATPGVTAIRRAGADIQLSFTSAPLAFYQILWTSNASPSAWNTLTNNVSGSGGTLQITDSGAITSQPQRFYRVQTPP
jgi:chitinase